MKFYNKEITQEDQKFFESLKNNPYNFTEIAIHPKSNKANYNTWKRFPFMGWVAAGEDAEYDSKTNYGNMLIIERLKLRIFDCSQPLSPKEFQMAFKDFFMIIKDHLPKRISNQISIDILEGLLYT